MKALAFAIVTVAVSAALANPPAAKTTTTTKKTETTHEMAPPADHAAATAKAADVCAGKTGKDLETCKKEEAKKAHH